MGAGAWLAVGAGAVLGAWMRFALSLWLNDPQRPFALGTWVANVAGALAIGLVAAWLARHPALSPLWRMFVMTGLLGAMTTFSTFSLESLNLLMRGQWGWALAHSGLHVFGCLGAAALGYRILAQ